MTQRNQSPVAVMGWGAAQCQMPMREKMARAMYERVIRVPLPAGLFPKGLNPEEEIHRWENQSAELHATWFLAADAALDALRDPTEGMRNVDVIRPDGAPPTTIDIFQAMVTAVKAGK